MKKLTCCFFGLLLAGQAGATPLVLADVQAIIARAATRAQQVSSNSVIAVVDREGFVLGVWAVNSATPPTAAQIGAAVSKAGTAAFLSSNQEALTSRTAGFIVQQHFPPNVKNKPPGPLVGVNFSNLPFSDINKFKGPGSVITFSSTPGTSIAPVPQTSLAGSPGGLPLYKGGQLAGGIGVTGDGTENIPATQTADKDEDVALAGQSGFAPAAKYAGSGILIDGIRLAYVSSTTKLPKIIAPLGTIGASVAAYPLIASPAPFVYPTLKLGGVTGEVRQPMVADPIGGTILGQARLTVGEVTNIISRAAARARQTRSGIRLPAGQPAQMFITVVNNPNSPGVAPTVLGTFRTPGATMFSWDVAVQKARTVIYFSSPTNAYSARTVGFLAQSLYPPGINGTSPGPFYGMQEQFSTPDSFGNAPNPSLPNGMTLFPGAFPLYRNGVLIGAVSVSGDGVDQDDLIAADGDVPFLSPNAIKADQFIYRGTRLPYAKFPEESRVVIRGLLAICLGLAAGSGRLFAVEKRFDVATLCCNCEEEHFCETHFDHLNRRSGTGHYLVMGTDAHRSKVVANGNLLAAYYDTLTENWKKTTGAEKAEIIHKGVLKHFAKTGPRPDWLILNEISAGTWPEEPDYRRWVGEVLSTLKNKYKYTVVICAPFTHPGAHDADWKNVAANAFIGIECYLSGKAIQDHTNSVAWCEKTYREARAAFEKRGVPAAKLFLVEHFAQTGPDKNWGRQGVSRAEWEKALICRSQAAHKVAFAGFVSYAWGRNAMQVSDEEVLHFEDLYLQQKLP